MSLKGAFAGVALGVAVAVAFGLQYLDDLDRRDPAFLRDPAARCGGRPHEPDSGFSGGWQGARWEAAPKPRACRR